MRPTTLIFASVLLAGGSLALACSSSDASENAAPDVDAGDAGPDVKRAPADAGSTGADAGPSTCELSRAYFVACKQDLNCGAKFDAWCAQNDQAINSDAYRRAEAKCLTTANCDPDRRGDCEYKSLASEAPTPAQAQLAAAYCQTCEPSDAIGCETRSTSYDPVAGPASVPDIFVAAWEFNDAVTDEMRTKCTGAALDAGTDAGDGGCAKAFAGCSADVYLAHLPDCPP